jgi:hypothetical protein
MQEKRENNWFDSTISLLNKIKNKLQIFIYKMLFKNIYLLVMRLLSLARSLKSGIE